MPHNKALLYLLLLSSLLPLAASKCCGTKSVGGKEYVLVGEDNQGRWENLGCLAGCTYQLIGDRSDKPTQYCFKSGDLESQCVEVPYPVGCVDPGMDPRPVDWVSLLASPCSRLSGPSCPGGTSLPVQRIGIVGAGMAGLTAAWILQTIGHQVFLLESTARIGGRVQTHYGDGWYGDLGPMRLPPASYQPLIHALINQFGVETQSFTNTNDGANSYYHLAGKYFSAKAYANSTQETIKEIYEIFGMHTKGPESKSITDNDGNLKNPSDILWDNILHEDLVRACREEESLERFLRAQLKKQGYPQELVSLWSVVELARAFLHGSFYQWVEDGFESFERKPNARVFGLGYSEIRNGTWTLPDTIFKNITNHEESGRNADITFNKKIVKVSVNEGEHVEIEHQDTQNQNLEKSTYDKVILTAPARPASLIKFSPPLAYNKTYALNSFHTMNSVKVHLVFSEPFWAFPNKAPMIPFNTSSVNGGSGVTDLPSRNSYYPSHPSHGPKILASYTWEDDANLLTSLPDEEVIQQCLADLVEIHGQVARETFREGVVKKWAEDSEVGGAFSWAYPYQIQTMKQALMEQHGDRVFFAGEYTAKEDHGWMQASVASACRVANDMFGKTK